MNLVDEIRAIVARETARDGEEFGDVVRVAQAVTELPEMASREFTDCRYREYDIGFGSGDHLKSEADLLAALRPLEIAAAPEVVALIRLRDGHVLVRRYWACRDERLLSVHPSETMFEPEACQRFRRDIEILAQHGTLHRYAGRGTAHWLVGERTGTIVLNTWGGAKPFGNDDERAQMLRGVDVLLTERMRPT